MIKKWIDEGMVYSERARAKMGAQLVQLSIMIDKLLNYGPTIGSENTTVEIEHDGIHFSIEYYKGIKTVMVNVEGSSIGYDYEKQKMWPSFFYMREEDIAYTYHIPLESGFPEEVITFYGDEDKLAEYCFRRFY